MAGGHAQNPRLTQRVFGGMQPSDWTALELVNGWEPYSAPEGSWGQPEVARIGNVGFLAGLITGPYVLDQVVAVIPEPFLPRKSQAYVVINGNDLGRINIYADGTVRTSVGKQGWWSLANIVYPVA